MKKLRNIFYKINNTKNLAKILWTIIFLQTSIIILIVLPFTPSLFSSFVAIYNQATTSHEWLRSITFAIVAIIGLPFVIIRTIAVQKASAASYKQAETAEQGHITERFTKAIEQLGSASNAIKLGGIFALEKIAQTQRNITGR